MPHSQSDKSRATELNRLISDCFAAIALEGTFPLPEAQLDRFLFQLRLGYPDASDERAIVLRNSTTSSAAEVNACWTSADIERLREQVQQVHVAEDVLTYALELVRGTRSATDLALGASPRASIALYRAARALACVRGRAYVTPDDIKALAEPVLCHRLSLAAEARLSGQKASTIVRQLLDRIEAPVESEAGAKAYA